MKDSEVNVASKPENGEFANSTVFVTSPSARHNIRIIRGVLGNISAFVLMSDGTGTSFYHKHNNSLSQAVKRIFMWTVSHSRDSMTHLLDTNFERLILRRTSDDCSIAILARPDRAVLDYFGLSHEKKRQFLGLPAKSTHNKRLEKLESIMYAIPVYENCVRISRKTGLRRKHLLYDLKYLVKTGLVEECRGEYRSLSENNSIFPTNI